MKIKAKTLFFYWAILLTPISAQAHPFHLSGDSIGFFSGLVDPFASADHILAMLAFGAWIFKVTRPLAYFLPFIFIGLMLLGCVFTLIPIEIAYAQQVFYVSVALVGLMLVSNYPLPLPIATLIMAVFGFFHGYIHAIDILLGIEAFMYTAGFSVGALVLIASGFVMRLLLTKASEADINRFLGGGH